MFPVVCLICVHSLLCWIQGLCGFACCVVFVAMISFYFVNTQMMVNNNVVYPPASLWSLFVDYGTALTSLMTIRTAILNSTHLKRNVFTNSSFFFFPSHHGITLIVYLCLESMKSNTPVPLFSCCTSSGAVTSNHYFGESTLPVWLRKSAKPATHPKVRKDLCLFGGLLRNI